MQIDFRRYACCYHDGLSTVASELLVMLEISNVFTPRFSSTYLYY